MQLKNKFKTWFNAERVGRVEEGTSQDMFQTNGSIIVYILMLTIFWSIGIYGIFILK